MLGSALTVAAVTVFTILGVKYSGRKKNISNPNDNDNNGDSSINNKKICSEIEPKITKINKIEDNNNNNEILIENNKKEEPKKKEPEEVDAASRILSSCKRQHEEIMKENVCYWSIGDEERYKSNFKKIERMLEKFFGNFKQNKYKNEVKSEKISGDLAKYFDGTSKIKEEYIKRICVSKEGIFIFLKFDEFPYLILIDEIEGKLILRVIKLKKNYEDTYRYGIPPNEDIRSDSINYFEASESDLLEYPGIMN